MSTRPPAFKFWRTRAGAWMGALVLSSGWAWWMIAWPVISFERVAEHTGHHALTYLHTVGGTGMLICGAINFYLGATKRHWRWHRWSGNAYLALGLLGSGTAVVVLLSQAHKDPAQSALTNITVSLLTLALGWLAFAAMGWRAARNRRFDSHFDWMVRAYILVWAFVACRIVSRTTMLEEGPSGEWLIWLSWVGPLIVGELFLQWNAGARSQGQRNPNL